MPTKRVGILLGLLAVLAGCGGHGAVKHAGPLHIARPSKPIWCPLNAPGSFDVRSVLGLAERKAEATITHHRCSSRLVEIDGHKITVTADLRSNRVDLTLERDTVTAVDVG